MRDLLTNAGAFPPLSELEACVNKLDFKGARAVLASIAQGLGAPHSQAQRAIDNV